MIVVDGDAGFAMAVYGRIAARDGNLVLSPASLRVALAMAYAGSRNETAAQFQRVLRLPADSEAAHAAMAAQLTAWGVPADGSPSAASAPLRVVNRVWLQRGQLREAFLVRMADSYRAPVGALDFIAAPELGRQAINRWVAEQTDHKIAQLLPPGSITKLTRFVLTNAVLFKASWAAEFSPAATRSESFIVATGGDPLKVPMMHRLGRYPVAVFDGGQLLELPYAGSSLVMDVILPSRPEGLPALERKLEDDLPRWLARLKVETVDLSLPRFRFACDVTLKEPLQALGVTDAFDGRADFSAIGAGLALTEVFHAAEIIVDEKGTEAAAATAVVGATRGGPSRVRVVEFRADHPFVFVIRDRDTGAIVFMGRVARPG